MSVFGWNWWNGKGKIAETRREAIRPREEERAIQKTRLKSRQRQHTLSREGGDRDLWFLHALLPGGPASTRSARNPAAPGDYYFRSGRRRVQGSRPQAETSGRGALGVPSRKIRLGGPGPPVVLVTQSGPRFSEGTSAAPTACHTCCENDTPRRMVPSLPPGRAIGHHTQSRNRHGPLISLEWLGVRAGALLGLPGAAKPERVGLKMGDSSRDPKGPVGLMAVTDLPQ